MSLELIGKFIGSQEIVSVQEIDFKTPKGEAVYEITFKDERSHIYPVKVIELIVSDEATDANYVQEKKFQSLCSEIMDSIAEYDVNLGEVQMLVKVLTGSIDEEFNKAASMLWFKNKKEHVPGFDSTYYASVLMAKRVLKENE